jgi:hypothetical protein
MYHQRAQQVAQSMVKEELYTPNGGWGHYPDYHPHYDYYPNAATTPHTNLQHQQVQVMPDQHSPSSGSSVSPPSGSPPPNPNCQNTRQDFNDFGVAEFAAAYSNNFPAYPNPCHFALAAAANAHHVHHHVHHGAAPNAGTTTSHQTQDKYSCHCCYDPNHITSSGNLNSTGTQNPWV